MTSIVIPAHNEARVIGRLLDSLLAGAPESSAAGRAEDETDIVVVCNGCTDDTARIAAQRGPRVRVVEIPVPSKHAALRAGDDHALGFPRLYVDADVVLSAAAVRALAAPLADDASGVLATAPERRIPLAGCGRRVRAYYRVWQRLPAVRAGLFGRGVIAVSKAGHVRIAALPPLMADDLAASLAFTERERLVVGAAEVVVHPPRTWRDLMNRRVRAAVSTAQVEQRPGSEDDAASARTGVADLTAMIRREPRLLPSVAVFLAAAVLARRRARRAIGAQDFGTWLRDDSSRQN
ncbi:glycosyltransferase family 2 protein [Streptomyces sp. NPDC023723]|uniref:glycosyltransferase family 2 protein n=1 Tax=Streptomyces sp. NPDC023723 TaxID=3154323 RepID=UPI0033CC41BF